MSALSPVLLAVAARADIDHVPTSADEKWPHWLSAELARRGTTPASRLLVLWDVLEEWLGNESLQSTLITGGAKLASHPTPAAVSANRELRHLLEQLAGEAGAVDPRKLAYQLQMLFEGAIVGALIDRRPQVTGTARHLARFALDASGCISSRGIARRR
jgi:hypothetical protein